VGMQIHAHDVKDEGVEVVLRNMQKAGVNAILPCANYVYELMNSPGPEILPHNPKRKRYYTLGGTYFESHLEYYENTKIKPAKTPEKDVKDFDVLAEVCSIAKKLDMEVYPWISCFKHPIDARNHPDCLVEDVYGRKSINYMWGKYIADWFCPNNPHAKNFSLAMIEDIVRSYDIAGVFVDRFRYPVNLGVCFCPYCQKRMKEKGLSPNILRCTVKEVLRKENETQFKKIVNFGTSTDLLYLFSKFPELLNWITFRMNSITNFIKDVYNLVKGINPNLKVGLDMINPAGAWFLGQNPYQLSDYCDWVKPMAYNKAQGNWIGAEISELSKSLSEEKDSSEIYKAFKAIYQVRGIKLPHTFEEFKKEGMPSSWVYDEAKITKELVGEKTLIHLGIQIWPPATTDDVKDSITKAFEANIDGIIMYCYGWAPLKNFAAAKDSLKRLGKL